MITHLYVARDNSVVISRLEDLVQGVQVLPHRLRQFGEHHARTIVTVGGTSVCA